MSEAKIDCQRDSNHNFVEITAKAGGDFVRDAIGGEHLTPGLPPIVKPEIIAAPGSAELSPAPTGPMTDPLTVIGLSHAGRPLIFPK